VHLATEDDLARDYAEFELGAVPPFGGRRDPVILDVRLAWRRCSHLWVVRAITARQSSAAAPLGDVGIEGAAL